MVIYRTATYGRIQVWVVSTVTSVKTVPILAVVVRLALTLTVRILVSVVLDSSKDLTVAAMILMSVQTTPAILTLTALTPSAHSSALASKVTRVMVFSASTLTSVLTACTRVPPMKAVKTPRVASNVPVSDVLLLATLTWPYCLILVTLSEVKTLSSPDPSQKRFCSRTNSALTVSKLQQLVTPVKKSCLIHS